ncbi:MAG: Phenylalanine--tRNA ligase beta subunit [Candidatus Methanolliviera sp. GoM_asphalt]|nr:MAG: Phenylalanine--tRNA ligase beta subunit [Candidatus Methanolliviera sp. GoM_asphalt]
MPVISLGYEDLEELVGVSKEEILTKIPMLGADIERVEEDHVDVEFFPNRPDLYSAEGVARALRGFLSIEEGARYYSVKESKIDLTVKDAVLPIRPHIASAVVKGIKFSGALIESLMNLQEHLHRGLGRDRRKISIGVHDLSKIEPPFTYTAVSPDFSFVPLDLDEEMTMHEILTRHPKGVKYRKILEDFDLYPIIFDAKDRVVSFPPIINAELTRVTEKTEDLFIDVTGTEPIVFKALNIVVSSLAERGGEIYSVRIDRGSKEARIVSPDLSYEEMDIELSEFRSLIGEDLTQSNVIESLRKMRYDADLKTEDKVRVKIPPYRVDILHPWDIIEDVAIGYGYENIRPEFPKTLTMGSPHKMEVFSSKIREVMIGLCFFEVITFTLTNEEKEFDWMRRINGKKEEIVTVNNPISTEHTMMRRTILPNLIELLSFNKHRDLPQRIFEIGDVILNGKTTESLAAVSIHSDAEFSEVRSYIDALFREMKMEAKIKNSTDPAFLEGRSGDIYVNKRKIGVFGEMHPEVVWNFKLEYPIVAMEINLEYFL